MRPNPLFPADLVTFTKEILNGRVYFLCNEFNIRLTHQMCSNYSHLTFMNLCKYDKNINPFMLEKVTHTQTNLQLSAKYMWPFCSHQALKG